MFWVAVSFTSGLFLLVGFIFVVGVFFYVVWGIYFPLVLFVWGIWSPLGFFLGPFFSVVLPSKAPVGYCCLRVFLNGYGSPCRAPLVYSYSCLRVFLAGLGLLAVS